ncbi:TolB-like translocation protein [Leptospira kanakyensis]|nr:DPP IV N-terminal domain-containing protein [Leptospira kanakyensis]MCW7469907.1 DPP IV N-terminal domain-containing protein [Leptospira kanakyensis]
MNDLFLGLALFSTFTNDGTIAYAFDPTQDDEIYLYGIKENRTINVTENVGRDLAPRWNPTGTSLAFNSRRTAHGHNRPEIYTMDFPSRNVRRVTNTSAPDENQRAAWYPDESTIVFQRGTYFAPSKLRLIKHDLKTGTESTLYEGGDKLHAAPGISADGTKLVFQSNKDFAGTFPSRLYMMDLSTSQITNFVHPSVDSGSDADPKWSPDGKWITFSSARNGGEDYTHIYIANVDTNEVSQITFGNYNDSAPDFSPNGKEIVFQSNRFTEFGLHIVSLDSKVVRYIRAGRTPVWSKKSLQELGF